MKTHDELKEEIYKCSKCGLCKSVCPVYLASKNEMFLPRGRYIVLNGFYNLKHKLTKKFVNELDICLNCNACKNFCPSNISSYENFVMLKNMHGYKYSFFNFSSLYKIILIFMFLSGGVYRFFPFKSFFLNSKLDNLYNKFSQRKQSQNMKPKGNVIYFQGCFNKYINDSDKNASLNLIEKAGFKTVKIIKDCCGYPLYNEGNLDKFKQNAEKIFSDINSDFDYIVCSCDSCFDTLIKAADFINLSANIKEKIITIDKFLKINNFILPNKTDCYYFKPYLRNNECYLPENINILNKKGMCSLMENFFVFKYKKLSKLISQKMPVTGVILNDKILVTSCNLAKWGIFKSVKKSDKQPKILSYSEFVDLITDK